MGFRFLVCKLGRILPAAQDYRGETKSSHVPGPQEQGRPAVGLPSLPPFAPSSAVWRRVISRTFDVPVLLHGHTPREVHMSVVPTYTHSKGQGP